MLSAYRARPAGSWLLLVFPRRRLAVRGNAKEDVATLTLEDTQGAARLSVWSVAGDNIVNDFESVNFIQSEKLRCMNNASESLDGEESTA